MPDQIANCYSTLELDPTASAEEIREAYLDLVKVWHPDRFTGESTRFLRKLEEKLKAINQAYESLRSGSAAFQSRPESASGWGSDSVNPDLRPMNLGEQWGYIDAAGKLVIRPRFDHAQPFVEGLAVVAELGRFGFIDGQGEYAIYPEFASARSFSEGLAAVVLSTSWGYINRQGGFEIIPSFEDCREFSEDAAAVKWRGRWGFVDRSGAFLVRPQFDDALQFCDGWAEIRMGDKWGRASRIGEVYINGQRICLEPAL